MSIQSSARQLARRAGLSVDRWPPRGSLEQLLAHIVNRYEVDSVVDVGANVGQWALNIRRVGYSGALLSIEPVSTAYDQLERAASRDRSWRSMRAAAGSSSGRATIHVADSTSTSSLLTVTDAYLGLYERARQVADEQVSMVRLDDLEVPGRRLLLKVDTQGFDRQVLDGASALMERTVAVQCELSVRPLYEGMGNDWLETTRHLAARGFELAGLFPLARDRQLRMLEMDGVFVVPSTT